MRPIVKGKGDLGSAVSTKDKINAGDNITEQGKNKLVKQLCLIISKLKKAKVIRDNRALTGVLGEYRCAEICCLRLANKNNQRDFDAYIRDDKKVQIKSSTTRTFYDIHDWDKYHWLYLVKMNASDFGVEQIYKVDAKSIKKKLLNKTTMRRNTGNVIRYDLYLSKEKINDKFVKLIYPFTEADL